MKNRAYGTADATGNVPSEAAVKSARTALGLGLDAFGHFTGNGVDTQLTGSVNQIINLHSLGIGAQSAGSLFGIDFLLHTKDLQIL